MFENLTERLSRTFKNLSGQGRLTEENMQQMLREVRLSLLEADVALPVVKNFIEKKSLPFANSTKNKAKLSLKDEKTPI